MLYLGLMSGTSADAIDAALVRLAPADERGIELVAVHKHPLPPEIRRRIQALTRPGAASDALEEAGALDTLLGELFAEAALALLAKAKRRPEEVRAIGSHGQTLRHRPDGSAPFTLQIANPAVIAERTGITTVADFRRRDLAAGGQGAPLVPAFHRHVFHVPGRARAILNIGGIANLTYLPAEPQDAVRGFDTGPGNTLLDQWIQRHRGEDYDRNGQWAAGGRVVPALLEALLADPYFARPPPKSTGREYFHLGWLERHLGAIASFAPAAQDVQATLLQLTARSAARALREFLPPVEELYVCGGGAHNSALIAALAEELAGIPVQTTDALGLAPDWVEAAAFAWLAHQTLEGRPGNLPSVTGARREVVLGGIYKA